MNLIESLKESCAQHHYHIRDGAYARKIMEHELLPNEYLEGLLANYLFHKVIEEGIEQQLHDTWKQQLNWQVRKKTHHILQDLQELGKADLINKLKQLKFRPLQINTPEEALGALYVIEGTAIGGAIIKRNLLKIPWVQEKEMGIHFYGCYGNTLSQLWKQFSAFMAKIKLPQQPIIAKAKETFLFYNEMKNVCNTWLYQAI